MHHHPDSCSAATVVVLLVCCPTIDGMTVGKTWVSNLLREHQRAMAAYFLAIKHRVPDPLPCNAVWGMDLTFKQDEAGDLHPILGMIDHGIRQRFSNLHCPWQNGRIERLFGTLKKTLNRITVANFAALSHAMLEFKTFYNHVRPHQHLQGRTPQETWDGIDPRRCAPKQARFVKAWGGLLTGYYVRR